MLSKKTIAVVGAGKLGETLIRALLDARVVPPERLVATAKHAETVASKEKTLGIRMTLDNRKACRGADVVILSVKPQAMEEVLKGIRSAVTPKQLVISTAACVGTAAIERGLGRRIPVVRTMPNTPALVRAGMTAVAPGRFATPAHLALAHEIFASMGRVLVLDEKHMDAVTGLSGSGPAFIYVVLEALAEGGLKVGLPREIATELIAQTMLGAAKMILETREHPAKLKDVVITPAGCTIDGLLELEEGGIRVALIKAVVRATARASQLLSR
ncbi:MAG: pyrroline-5-carboxylate reductase [Planctomycetes bacterium]|nr:pyrroline-5-carboxylate reductase [Planctomycetota bacterium]